MTPSIAATAATLFRQIITMSLLTILGTSAQAQDFKCNPSGNQQEMNVCASESLGKIQKEVKDLYNTKMKALKTKTAQELLEQSQQTWEQYTEARCLYEAGKKEESGSIWPLVHDKCLETATKERIGLLKRYVACNSPQKGCPI